ncbi:MAG: DMT family transporter [Alphaproteobacteria bacterium]|nr:DMT family transporter [Alphaproteobacteria bacterium]
MRRGIVDMLLAVVAFTLMLAAVKVAGRAVTPVEIVVWRGVIGSTVLLPVAWSRGLRVQRPRLLLLRTVLGAAAMVCWFTAIQGLSLAETNLIGKVQPLIIAVAAPLLLGAGEKPDTGVWVALALGSAGCGVLLAPDAWSGSVHGLWAVGAAVFAAAAHLTLRVLGREHAPLVIVWWFQVGTSLLVWTGGSLARGQPLPLPPLEVVPMLLAVAACATAGQLFMTRAYRQEQAAAVATTSYAGPVVSVIVDLVLFGAVPGWTTLAGGALVVGAGWILLTGRLPFVRRVPPVVGS